MKKISREKRNIPSPRKRNEENEAEKISSNRRKMTEITQRKRTHAEREDEEKRKFKHESSKEREMKGMECTHSTE